MKKVHTVLLALMFTFLFIPVAQADTLSDIKRYVEQYYYGPVPKNLRAMTTIEQVMNELDSHSFYMTRSEYILFKRLMGNEISVFEPLRVSGVVVENSNYSHVQSTMLAGQTGYIRISTFSLNLGQSIASHWMQLQSEGAERLIIDLRNNGGGYVKSAEELIGFFEGTPIAYHLKTRTTNERIASIPASLKFPKETYILQNVNSASAAEMVAAAVKDQRVATLVGGKSRGKGSIQSIFELQDGGALKMTTGHFLGPKGTIVNQIGIQPDIQTRTGQELTELHRDLMMDKFKQQHMYATRQTETMKPTAPIRLQIPSTMNFQSPYASYEMELIQIGGGSTKMTIPNNVDGSIIEFLPPTPLERGGNYILTVQPTIPRLNGKPVKTGAYTEITIEK